MADRVALRRDQSRGRGDGQLDVVRLRAARPEPHVRRGVEREAVAGDEEAGGVVESVEVVGREGEGGDDVDLEVADHDGLRAGRVALFAEHVDDAGDVVSRDDVDVARRAVRFVADGQAQVHRETADERERRDVGGGELVEREEHRRERVGDRDERTWLRPRHARCLRASTARGSRGRGRGRGRGRARGRADARAARA